MAPPRILVVDDESEQRRLFRRLLESDGLEVCVAASAYEALEITKDASARPDLILSDIAMPGLDGAAFIKAVRSAAETASIPVIMMTGLKLPAGLMSAGAEAMGVGPIHLKGSPLPDLLSRVRALLKGPARRQGIVIDALKRAVWIDDCQLPELPARRFQLLCALLRQPRGLSREELLDQVWDGKENLNIVGVTVLRLREDLKHIPFLRIETVPAGYRLLIGPRQGSS